VRSAGDAEKSGVTTTFSPTEPRAPADRNPLLRIVGGSSVAEWRLEVGRNAKLGIALVAVLVVVGITFAAEQMMLAIAAVIIGGVGIFFLLQQDDEDDGDDEEGPVRTKRDPKAKKGKARLDEILDDKAAKSGEAKTRRPTTPTAPAGGGLPTWTPGSIEGGTPSVDDLDDLEPATDSWDTWEKEWPQGDDADTLVLTDDDPLGSLDRLDDIDPVVEVEPVADLTDDDPFASLRADIVVEDSFEIDEFDSLDGLAELDADLEADRADDRSAPAPSGSAFSFAAAPAVINEEVSTADDIMAASTATELHVEEAGDSELARLLAKVQARLSAYE